jgi:aspartyl protease family protein
MFRRKCLTILLLVAFSGIARASDPTDNPDQVFESVYARIGALPAAAARDRLVWLKLEELKREPCDQRSIDDLAAMLDRRGYRRQTADGLYKFVLNCGAPLTALNKATVI